MNTNVAGRLARFGLEKPTLIGMCAVVMWSGTIGLYRGVSQAFGAVGGPALIFTVSALIALVWAGPQAFRGMSRAYVLIGGALFITYEIALALAVGYAQGDQQALEVGTVNYLWPSFTIALTVGLGIDKADWRMVPGLLLSLFGVLWVTSGDGGISLPVLIANIGANPWAYGLAFVAALVWPLYTLVTRAISGGYNGVPLFLAATAVALWIKFFATGQPALVFDMDGALMVLVFGILTTAAYSAWNHGVLHGNLTLMATASYFAPVLSVLSSSVILAMVPGVSFWIGASLVTCGSLICWISTRGKSA